MRQPDDCSFSDVLTRTEKNNPQYHEKYIP
jgi:hypothetical protein